MSTETIQYTLQERFAVPLPDFYRRRIIFWLDEEREFEDVRGQATTGVCV